MAWPRHLVDPPSPSPSPRPPPSGVKMIHPTLLLIIIIVSLLFFLSSVVYLVVRFLHKKDRNSSSSNTQSNLSPADALQRQLQQLFSLHDTGLDQSSIDSLPVFTYKEILGPKDPFDCAVCLSEFSPKDKLRLLPHCTHAFHINCIDTWLLSNSTCPLCRRPIFPPPFLSDSPLSDSSDPKSEPSSVKGKAAAQIEEGKKGVLPVSLGKFRKVDPDSDSFSFSFVGEASNSNMDARRCYSMGSYQYVVGNTSLRVALCPDQDRRRRGNKPESPTTPVDGDLEGRRITSVSRGDSYSISKIWLWKKKGAAFSGIAQIDLPHLSGGTGTGTGMESATHV